MSKPTSQPVGLRRRQVLSWLSIPPVLAAGGAAFAPKSTAAQVAQRLPAWNLQGLEGNVTWAPTTPTGNAAASAPWLYLDFWASWCGPCRLSFPWMNRMHEQWSAKGLRIVAVTVDRRREDALSFLRANPAKFEVALDPQAALARSLDVKTMPTSLLVAPDGRIVHRHEGFTASLGDKAAQSIKEALGG